MIVLLPYEFHDKEKAQEFVKEYMIQINSCYKTNNYLYCFKLFKQGKGMYADIICFTRKYYDRKQINMEIWNQDYYWNPVTKKRCKKIILMQFFYIKKVIQSWIIKEMLLLMKFMLPKLKKDIQIQ